MLIAGVDEAGRGPIIGPMVIAGIMIRDEDQNKLVEIGVKDSKMLTRERRQKLYYKIVELSVDWTYQIVTPMEIDQAVQYKRRTGIGVLNKLEAEVMAKIINKLKPDVAYVDSADVDEERFRRMIMAKLTHKVEVISKHKADQIYPVVSAASIIAKVKRDSIIDEIKRIYGDVGSGYPSDPKTILFIKKCLEKGGLPDFVRRSWSTLDRVRREM
ncbi:MAG: ribonuclease HII [archaeon YNP-LCB-024-027]|nr:ribonuclease HII [Candidatus Culexarchaeum yellowstonense]